MQPDPGTGVSASCFNYDFGAKLSNFNFPALLSCYTFFFSFSFSFFFPYLFLFCIWAYARISRTLEVFLHR